MAKRKKRRSSEHYLTKQENALKSNDVKPEKLNHKSLKHDSIIILLQQIPFWWKESEEIRAKIFEWFSSFSPK